MKPMKPIVAISLALVLMFAAAVAGLLVVRAEALYFFKREAQRSQSPATTVIAEKLGDTATPAELCLLGDSRVAGWTTRPEALNLGLSGATTAEIRGAVDSIQRQLLGQTVVIQCGINDLKTLPYNGHDVEAFATRVADDIIALARDQIRLGAERVVVTGIFPTGPVPLARRPFWGDSIEQGRILANKKLKNEAETVGFVFVDTDGVLADKALFYDTLHLNQQGYEALDRLLQ